MTTVRAAHIDPNSPDLVSVGRISVDLYGEQIGSDLSSSTSFRRYIGGSAGNIAVGTSRLGLNTAMIARIGADGFGDYLVEELEREGVHATAIVRDPERSTGTIVLAMHEKTDFPRSFLVQDPAEFNLSPEDIDQALIRRAGAVVITGSLLSRPNLSAAAEDVIEAARQGKTTVIFDVDYRPAFWGVVPRTRGENLVDVTPEVTERLQSVLPHCDVVVGTEAEICALGGCPDVHASLRRIRELSTAIIIYKVGAMGCYAFDGPIPDQFDRAVFSPGFRVEVVNSVGAGDAFMSGFLRGFLTGEPIERALEWANAAGAIVVGRQGCSGDSPSKEELDEFISRSADLKADDAPPRAISKLQFNTATRHRARPELFVLAIDHRGHLERIASTAGAAPSDIARFKEIAISAFLETNAGNSGAGILVDDVYVPSSLRERIADSRVWNARAVEISGRAPVQFGGSGDIARFVNSWPKEQVVKVLVVTSAGEDPIVRFANQERLRALVKVCRNLHRDLLVEILPAPGYQNSGEDLADLLEAWYAAGIRPAWWKLPAMGSADAWHRLHEIVMANDPGCRGFVILGGGTGREQLATSFRETAGVPSVRGFAVGRPIFHEPATEWLSGRIGDDAAAEQIIANYRDTVQLWHTSR